MVIIFLTSLIRMGRNTKKRRYNSKKTKKQRGGLTPEQIAAMGALGKGMAGILGGPRRALPSNSPAPVANLPPANDPLGKYKKMLKMGQPEGAVIQKMLTNGKNPKNLFPGYGPPAQVVKEGFTLDELRDLKDYVGRSEIIVRLNKLGINPNELYPELSPEEISTIIEDYSKPRAVPVAVPVVNAGVAAVSMKNALKAAIKGRAPVNGVKSNISFYTDYTVQEQKDLTTIDATRARLKVIESTALPDEKKAIKKLEERGEQIKDFKLKAILALLKEKRDLENTISTLYTPNLKNKVEFVKGKTTLLRSFEDKNGPLPRGWSMYVNSTDSTIYYQNKYTLDTISERPTEESSPVELPEGWLMQEDEIDAWYLNTLTGKTQWILPTGPAQLFDTTGWEKMNNPDGSYVWFQPLNSTRTYNADGNWYRFRDADKLWFGSPYLYPDQKFNKAPALGQSQNVTNSWMTL
jgi:hypothetical protein